MPMRMEDRGTSILSRGAPALAVAGLHVLIIYGLASVVGIVEMPKFVAPMETVFIEDPISEPQPEIEEIKPEIENIAPVEEAVPDLQIEELIAPPAEVVTPPSDTAIAAAPPDAGNVSRQLQTSNRIEPVYPPTSRRMGEEGTVRLRVLVDERGRPSDIDIASSSGFSRLDQAAIEAVKRWRFVAARDGSGPISVWTQVAITFRLTDAR